MGFRTSWPKMGVLGDKIGEGVVRYWP